MKNENFKVTSAATARTKVRTIMKMGDAVWTHTSQLSRWQSFWLRFMGWKVEHLD